MRREAAIPAVRRSRSPREARGRRVRAHAFAETLVLVALVGWWLTSRSLPPTVFPTPLEVATALGRMLLEEEFWSNAAATGLRVVGAVTLATMLGTIIGLLPRYLRWTSGIVDDVLVPFFSSFPTIALAILGTVWFGVTPKAILFIQTLIVFPFCLVNVNEGARSLGKEEVEMGRSFGRSRLPIFWHIELPLLSPFIIAGARIAYGISWKTSLIAELFGARAGLGFLMQLAQDTGRVDRILAICIAIVVIVIVGESLVLNPLARALDARSRFGITGSETRTAFGFRRRSGAPADLETAETQRAATPARSQPHARRTD